MLKVTAKKTDIFGTKAYQGVVTCYTDDGVKVWSEATNIDVMDKANALLDGENLKKFHESISKYPDSQF